MREMRLDPAIISSMGDLIRCVQSASDRVAMLSVVGEVNKHAYHDHQGMLQDYS